MVDPREADRRRGDRRQTDRRGGEAVGGRRAEDRSGHGAQPLDFDWPASSGHDSRFLDREVRPRQDPHDTAFVRVVRAYVAARAAIGLSVVAVLGVGVWGSQRTTDWAAFVTLAYAAQAISLWLLPRLGALAEPATGVAARRRQWLSTIGVDVLAFSLLHAFEVGASFNYAALLVLPVLMAGVLTSRLRALGTTAAVVLVMLALAWRAGGDTPTLMLQTGLAGLGLFVITVLASELSGRLAREELAARGSLEMARQQAQLNRLVIEEMVDGVLVVDHALQVRAANPAARALLVDQGLSPPAPFALDRLPAWRALWSAAQQAVASGQWPEAGVDVALAFGQGHTRTLRLRVRFMRGRTSDKTERAARPDRSERNERDPQSHAAATGEPAAVLLLEDLRSLQARIHQEKLAAMGRISAGIAHEIRNPLAAIAQANALLMEDPLPAPQQQLAAIVADNVQRLKRLVDEVMEVAPGAVQADVRVDAASAVAHAAADWARTQSLPAGATSPLRADVHEAPLGVAFDPEHLRRVLVNLLDNALRHASREPGSVFLRLAPVDEHRVLLSVLSDGAPITPEVERRLFEPFFSTRSRGTGLGLYICRELCERHGASIEYRPRPAAERLRNEFVVRFRRVALASATLPLPLAAGR
jgi:two-component system, NtrC family, sensor histidine kinase PilS